MYFSMSSSSLLKFSVLLERSVLPSACLTWVSFWPTSGIWLARKSLVAHIHCQYRDPALEEELCWNSSPIACHRRGAQCLFWWRQAYLQPLWQELHVHSIFLSGYQLGECKKEQKEIRAKWLNWGPCLIVCYKFHRAVGAVIFWSFI